MDFSVAIESDLESWVQVGYSGLSVWYYFPAQRLNACLLASLKAESLQDGDEAASTGLQTR